MLRHEAESDSALRWVNDWESRITEQAAQARALSQRIAELSATATSNDGTVTVTIDSAGTLRNLRLDEAIRRRPAAETATQILAVTQSAMRLLAEQAGQAAEETAGLSTRAARAVIDSYVNRLSTFAGAGGMHDHR